MGRFVVSDDRSQSTLLSRAADDYLGEDNPVRAIDVFVDELDLVKLGFSGVEPEATGRPAYHPATLLKIYVYGYLNRVQSSRRLERECRRNIELVWLIACASIPDAAPIGPALPAHRLGRSRFEGRNLSDRWRGHCLQQAWHAELRPSALARSTIGKSRSSLLTCLS